MTHYVHIKKTDNDHLDDDEEREFLSNESITATYPALIHYWKKKIIKECKVDEQGKIQHQPTGITLPSCKNWEDTPAYLQHEAIIALTILICFFYKTKDDNFDPFIPKE